MENTTANASSIKERSAANSKPLIIAGLVMLALVAAYIAWNAWSVRQTITGGVITTKMLEEQYGLQVRLIAVTAGGGMVDFRLKVLDAGKASQLLSDPERTPQLRVKGSGETLKAPPVREEIPLEDGGVYFILFPNSGSAIQAGAEVIVHFGEDLQLEPIPAK